MARNLNLGVAQLGPVDGADSRQKTVGRMVELVREAADRRTEFLVFPELALTTFFPRHWAEDVSVADAYYERSMPNPEVAPLFDAARAAGMGFYLGYAELKPDGQRFNTSIVVNRAGEIVGKYRKIHLPGHAEHRPDARSQHLEKRYFEVGDLGFGVFDVDGHLMGMGLCNDRRWPETYRSMSLQSAEIAVFGFNTPSADPDRNDALTELSMFHHLLSIQAGAYQNSMWVAAAGKSGVEEGSHMIGGSAIVAPSGELINRASTEADELIVSKIDLDLAVQYRKAIFDFNAHRRTEAYGLIVERRGWGDPLPLLRDRW